ncbi:hypothetical protein FACS18945_4870 [Bacteroidia bacterium]|nr:hypothetical protein FACS18945_4870 [Bacteroidia bacterium]
MMTYQIQIDERLPLGQSILSLLQSAKEAVTLKAITVSKPIAQKKEKSELYYSLERAFHDVRLMMDGKKPKKTLDQLIEELRNDEELRGYND